MAPKKPSPAPAHPPICSSVKSCIERDKLPQSSLIKRRFDRMTTKISQQEFARRRRNLMAQMEPDSIAIVPAAREKIRNRDVEFPFRQDSDFYYLTGFAEPDAVLVLLPGRTHG